MPTNVTAGDRALCKIVFPLSAFADRAAVLDWLASHGVAGPFSFMLQTDGASVAFDPDEATPPPGPYDVDVVDGALVHYPPRTPTATTVSSKAANQVRVAKGEVSASGNVFETAPASTAPTEAERIAKLPADVRRLAADHQLSAHNAEELSKVLTASGPIAADRISPAALLHLRGLSLIQETRVGVMGVRMVEPGLAAKVERATKAAAYVPAHMHPTLAGRPRAEVATKAASRPMDRALLGSMFGTRGV